MFLTEAEHDTLLAVVLAPDIDPGPPGAGEAPIALDAPEPITLPDLAARIEAATGRTVEIEERPARSTDGTYPLVTPRPRARSPTREHSAAFSISSPRNPGTAGNGAVRRSFSTATGMPNSRRPPRHQPPEEAILGDRPRANTRSLRAVFESWAGAAGWALTWAANATTTRSPPMPGSPGRSWGPWTACWPTPPPGGTLIATAYEANRQLVIEEVP